jgi:hypothetical protein
VSYMFELDISAAEQCHGKWRCRTGPLDIAINWTTLPPIERTMTSRWDMHRLGRYACTVARRHQQPQVSGVVMHDLSTPAKRRPCFARLSKPMFEDS